MTSSLEINFFDKLKEQNCAEYKFNEPIYNWDGNAGGNPME